MFTADSGGSETDHAFHYDAAELSPVIGEWVEGEQGFQFTGTIPTDRGGASTKISRDHSTSLLDH